MTSIYDIKSFLVLYVFFLLQGVIAGAQPLNYTFRHITTADGLASNNVTSIVQDGKGFIWISTDNGLQKYDGYSFTTYHHEPADTTSLSSDDVTALLTDRGKNIWLNAWPWGFNRFNIKTGKNTRLYHWNTSKQPDQDLPINACLDEQGNIWLLSTNILEKYDIKAQRLISFADFLPKKKDLDFNGAIIFNPRTHCLWFGSATYGICIFDPGKNVLYYRENNPLHLSVLNLKEHVGTLFLDSRNCLWISAYGDRFFRYDVDKGELKRITVGPEYRKKITVDCFLEDRNGDIWFAARDLGLLQFSYKTGSFRAVRSNNLDPAGLHFENSLGSLFEDKEGNIWIATDNGVNIFNPGNQKFMSVLTGGLDEVSLAHYPVQSILERKSGDIWVATYGGGIYVYDKFLQLKHIYTSDIRHPGNPYALGEPGNRIWSLLEDRDGKIFIGAQHGWFSIYDPVTGRFLNRHLPELLDKTITNMVFDKDRNIYMGLYGGFARWDRKNNTFTMNRDTNAFWTKHPDVVSNMVADSKNNLWVTSLGHGLQKFDLDSGHFTESYTPEPRDPHSISSWCTLSVACVNDSVVATGTNGNGIDLFNLRTRDFMHITTADGLPGNSISAMWFQPPSDLWAATSQGLCMVNLSTGKVITYGLNDGIASNKFGDLVHMGLRKNGQLMVGFTGGFVCFNPDSVRIKAPPKDVSITGINVFEQSLSLDSILDRSDSVNFSYKQNFISIQYASLSYMGSDLNHYYYRLEGVDKGWVDAGRRRIAYYTNLPAGNYNFKVKCENGDGAPSGNITSLLIVIHPPFWQSWWFYTLCALAALSLMYSFYYTKVKGLEKKLEFRNAVARDLHDDLGSTLSGINIYSRLALEKIKVDRDESESLMSLVSDRSEKMMDALSDIVWSLNVRTDNMGNIVSKMKEYAAEMLERQQIACKWMVEDEVYGIKLNTLCSKELYLIFKEVINNASKYSRAALVKIDMAYTLKQLSLTVSDNGKGFKRNYEGRGNGLNNICIRAKKIKAFLQIDSEPGEGTLVRLSVPLP